MLLLIVNLDQSKFDRVHTNLQQHHTSVKDLCNIFFYLRIETTIVSSRRQIADLA